MYKGKDIVIDRKEKRYKKMYAILGIPLLSDGWQPLPEIKQVSITKRGMSKRLATGISVVNTSSIGVELYFIYLQGNKQGVRIEVTRTKSLKKTLKVAQGIANYLNVECINYLK